MIQKKEKLLIMGASSYIARNFIILIADDYDVIKTERKSEKNTKDTLKVGKYNEAFFLKFLKKYRPEKIVNFIGIMRTNKREKNNFSHFFKINCQISIDLLEAIKGIPKYNPKVILIGSAAEYGLSSDPKKCTFSEESELNPISFYGITKAIQTGIGLFYARKFGMDITIVRFSNIMGCGMRPGFFISDIMSQIKDGHKMIKVGNLSSIRDFIAIRDAAEGLKRILKLKIKGKVINVSSGKGTVLRTITNKITQLRNAEFKELAEGAIPDYSVLNNDKLIETTRFRPGKNIDAIIEEITKE